MADKLDDSLFEDTVYDEALFDDTEFTPEELAASPEPAVEVAESVLQGATRGITLGASGQLAGAFEAGGRLVGLTGVGGPITDISLSGEGPTLSGEELLKAYKEGRAGQREREGVAQEAHPGAFIAAELVGGVATPIPGAAIAKMGKVGATVAKVLPSMKGVADITKTGKLAQKAKKLDDFRRYKILRDAQRAKSVALASREGLKFGAISSVAMGDASLLEGDVAGTIKEAVVGGTLGAAMGAGITGVGQVVKGVILKVPGIQNALDSFSFGVKGITLDNDVTNQKIATAAGKFAKELNTKLMSLGSGKKAILQKIDEAGIKINTRDDLEKARRLVSSIDSKTEQADAAKFLNVLDDYLGDGVATKKAMDRLEKDLIKSGLRDPAAEAQHKLQKQAIVNAVKASEVPEEVAEGIVEGIPTIAPGVGAAFRKTGEKIAAAPVVRPNPSKIQRTIDPGSGREVLSSQDLTSGQIKAIVTDVPSSLNAESLSTEQAARLQGLLKRYSSIAKKDNLPAEVTEAATQASVAIKDKLSGAAKEIKQPLDAVNKKLTSLLNVSEHLKLRKMAKLETDKIGNQQKLATFISGTSDNNPLSDKSVIMKQLRKVDPELANSINTEIMELRRLHQLSQPMEHVPESASFRALVGTASSLVNKVSNAIGVVAGAPVRGAKAVAKSVSKAPSKVSMADKSLDIIEASPETINSVVSQIQSGESAANKIFLEPLKKAANASERSRQAILFGLYQQPAFREMVDSLTKDEVK
jgi:hypothetical protein